VQYITPYADSTGYMALPGAQGGQDGLRMELLLIVAVFVGALAIFDGFASGFGVDTRWTVGDDHRRDQSRGAL
jgi:hypothetical protein